ncbi:MAG: hypothetical protein ACR2KI_00985 [Candidatus Limnocylindria bacterium]
MDLLVIGMRLVHIVSGVAWVGGAALFFFYIEPTVTALGPDGEKVIDELVGRRKVPIYFAVASTLTVLGGAILYWRDSGGLQLSWITSSSGLFFTIGGIAALIAWLGGNLLIPKTIGELGGVGAEIKAAGGPPSPELMGRMHAVQEKLRRIGLVDLVLLTVAVVTMAAARYI